jgi:phosphoribosylcarboxyaminoimidazole (NCAIR) mutase
MAENQKRRVVVMVGSDSDLGQCADGLEYLYKQYELDNVDVFVVVTASIHRNTDFVLEYLRKHHQEIDAMIVGAGWANHLTGTVDAYLRYTLKNDKTVVFGVAFKDENNPENTKAATLSITCVPGTQVVYKDYIGVDGFYMACRDAVEKELPKIKLKDPKPIQTRLLIDALNKAKMSNIKKKE